MVPKVVVIGSINMDLLINTPKIPVNGESMVAKSLKQMSGGKGANQAIALSRMGCAPIFSCKLGRDEFGKTLMNNLKNENIDTQYVYIDDTEKTGTAVILVEPNGCNRIIVVPGANMAYRQKEVDKIKEVIKKADIVVLQLEIPLESTKSIIEITKEYKVSLIIDAGPAQKIPLETFKGVDILSPNESETYALTNIEIKDFKTAKMAAEKMLDAGVKSAVLKLGPNGAMIADAKGCRMYPAYRTDVVDTSAAGDAFTAAMTYYTAMGKNLDEAVDFANAVGGLTASNSGTIASLPTMEQIQNFIVTHEREEVDEKWI